MANINWGYLFFLLLSHHPQTKLDHTIHLRLRKTHLFLCTRCTGIFIGFITIIIPTFFAFTLPLQLYLPLISILPFFAVIDWFTQSAKLRQSNTWIRVSSGFLLGISEALGLLLLFGGFYFYFMIALGVVFIYILIVYAVAYRTRCLDAYLKEMLSSNQELS